MKRFLIGLAVAGVLLGTTAFLAPQADDDLFELRKNFEIFGALYEEIVLNYVDEVRPQPFMRSGINAMLDQLDPYTHYYDEADMVDLKLLRQQSSGDVGLSIGVRGGRITILAPEQDLAPYRQGIRTGDVLLRIGESSMEGLSVEDIYGLMAGEPGSTIEVLVQRPGEETPRAFILRRVRRNTENVSYSGYLGGDSTRGIGYVRLNLFGDRSGREVRRAFRNMDRSNGLNSLVLDLRDNGGGILAEAVEIVGLFVPKGSVVATTRSRVDGQVQTFRTETEPLFPDVPVVVLVNRFSASASEIVAGALQDHDRAVVMGETTFGKGLVQIVRPLPHNTMLKITISHYYLPSGRAIQSRLYDSESAHAAVPDVGEHKSLGGRLVRSGVGIEPDVTLTSDKTGSFEEALMQDGAFFLFADAYIAEECAEVSEVCLENEDRILAAFEDFLERTGFEWQSEADRKLDEFEASFVRETGDEAPSDLQNLRAELQNRKASAVQDYREVLIPHLKAELRSRILSGPERIERELDIDPWIGAAVETAADPQLLSRILSGN